MGQLYKIAVNSRSCQRIFVKKYCEGGLLTSETSRWILVLILISFWTNEVLPVMNRGICKNFMDHFMSCRRFVVRVLLALDKLTVKEQSIKE